MAKSNKQVAGEFASHLIFGALMFSFLVVVTIGIHSLVHYAEGIIFDWLIITLLGNIDKIIFIVDAVVFVWWLVTSTKKAIEELDHE
jgi:hypothetical protein